MGLVPTRTQATRCFSTRYTGGNFFNSRLTSFLFYDYFKNEGLPPHHPTARLRCIFLYWLILEPGIYICFPREERNITEGTSPLYFLFLTPHCPLLFAGCLFYLPIVASRTWRGRAPSLLPATTREYCVKHRYDGMTNDKSLVNGKRILDPE